MKYPAFLLTISVVILVLRREAICVNPSRIRGTDCRVVVRRISDQSQFDLIMKNLSDEDHNTTRCIHLSLTGNNFIVDLPQLMRINLGTNGSLVITGYSTVINCSTTVTDLESLRNTLQPISRADLAMFDGLVFIRCPVPIVIEEVSNVVIQNCVFWDHEHGAVNIFNSPNVIVKNCSFDNNTSSSYFTRQPFQGNAGGLSIGYNSRLATMSLNDVNIIVTDCNFTNNHAAPPTSLQLSPNELQARRIFSGRGGGLSIVINITDFVNATINSSIFVNNTAENFGGGVYMFISDTSTSNQLFTFGNNVFIMNRATHAGAFSYGNFVRVPQEYSQTALFYNCMFIRNQALLAGGLNVVPSFYGLPGRQVRFVKCGFHKNLATIFSGAVDISSYRFYDNRQSQSPAEFLDCIFDDNYGADGASVSLIYSTGTFNNVTFSNHRGPALRVIEGKLNFTGPASFVNNNVGTFEGGAIYLILFSQIVLNPGTHLNFINNTGRNGAAIVHSSRPILPAVFEKNFFNPLCSIMYTNPSIPPVDWDQVSVNFTGNQAIIGSAIYTNEVALCSWYSYSPPHFKATELPWPFMSFGRQNSNTGHKEDRSNDESLAIQTPAVNFLLLNQTIMAYPGESIKLVIISLDELNHPTSDNIQIQESMKINDYSLVFMPTASILLPRDPSVVLRYRLKSPGKVNDDILRSTYRIQVSAFRAHFPEVQYFNLTVIPCPPGHLLLSTDEEDEYECQCNENNDENIVRCLPEERSIVLEEGYWAHHVDDGLVNGMLEYYQCPPGYCQCSRVDNDSSRCNSIYYYDDDNRQCVCDREDILCGQCRNGKGVSALLNNCVSCGKTSVLLIIALVIVDIIVIITILLCSLSLKPWLYPFLFYLQVAPYIGQYFPATFSAVHPYLYYISSAVSLYFPYDFCLYPGMTALVSYSLRYIPLLLTVIISTVFYGANKYFKVGREYRLSWSGLWVLILLLSTDVLNTSMSILNCPSLSDSSGNKNMRWFVDGSVKCFTGGHLPLAIVAILILILYMLLIIFVTAVVFKRIKTHWAFSMAAILHDPYTNQCYWWAPSELLRRLLFILLITAVPGNLALLLLLMMVLITLCMYTMPYQKLHINLLELFVMTDLVVLLMVALTEQFKDQNFRQQHNELVDECGRANTISEHVTMMIPLYYIPLLVLLIVLVVKLSVKIKAIYKERFKHQQDVLTNEVNMDVISHNAPVITYYMELSTPT